MLRVTVAGAAREAGVLDELPEGVGADDWFMDYRNADGSVAQMCGNGVRVFAHYLRAAGLERRTSSSSARWPDRALSSCIPSTLTTADVSVEMGKVNQLGTGEAVDRRQDVSRASPSTWAIRISPAWIPC